MGSERAGLYVTWLYGLEARERAGLLIEGYPLPRYMFRIFLCPIFGQNSVTILPIDVGLIGMVVFFSLQRMITGVHSSKEVRDRKCVPIDRDNATTQDPRSDDPTAIMGARCAYTEACSDCKRKKKRQAVV